MFQHLDFSLTGKNTSKEKNLLSAIKNKNKEKIGSHIQLNLLSIAHIIVPMLVTTKDTGSQVVEVVVHQLQLLLVRRSGPWRQQTREGLGPLDRSRAIDRLHFCPEFRAGDVFGKTGCLYAGSQQGQRAGRDEQPFHD